MSCARTRRLLDAWLDDELDASTQAEIGRHIAQCPTCEALRSERACLRETIHAANLRMTAPASLAARVRQALETATLRPPPRQRTPSWWMVPITACMGAFIGALAMFAWVHHAQLETRPDDVVTRHVAALARADGRAERLVQVADSDRHVVKPWFQGKVDIAPPVRDLASEGFTLLGARLDRVDGRVAAVIVYRIRNHPVELFAWRTDEGQKPLRVVVDRGFGIASWTEPGLGLAAVSDVDPRDLERFARAVQSGQAAPL